MRQKTACQKQVPDQDSVPGHPLLKKRETIAFRRRFSDNVLCTSLHKTGFIGWVRHCVKRARQETRATPGGCDKSTASHDILIDKIR